MIDDKTWLRAVRMVSRPGASRNEFDVKVDDRFLYNPQRGWRSGDGRPMSSNPQLQVLGDYTRRNPLTQPVTRRNLAPTPDGELTSAIKKFHGTSSGDVVAEYAVDDGNNEEISLAYLGHVPAVAWLSKKVGSSPKQIDVNGELVRFDGFRNLFRGQSRPVLALHTPTNEAVIVQGTVDSLKDRCDSSGVLGFAPVVEYIVEAVEGSTKGDYHYVHEFEKDAEPVLRWDDTINGLVYDRDRTLVASRRKNPKKPIRKHAVYEITDWFHEGQIRRHGER